MKAIFVINGKDNVGTALDGLDEGQLVSVIGEAAIDEILLVESVRPEHKVALKNISSGEDILKYGMPIGYATRNIAPGEAVHLHNCASHYDERSNTLDNLTGAPTDIDYA